MANSIKYSSIFEKYFKRYKKKYRSLETDIEALESLLLENPELGTHLGNGLYKIRLSVKSKNRGKSGGFRVITYLVAEDNTGTEITLLILYDKSEIENFTVAELLEIVANITD